MDYHSNAFQAIQTRGQDLENDMNANGQVVNIANTSPACSTRFMICNAIMTGQVQEATSLLINKYPQAIEGAPELCFRLMRMHFIQLVRENRKEDALEFAHQHMLNLSQYSPSLNNELKMTMSVMALDNLVNKLYSEYFDPTYRMDVAAEVNNFLIRMLPQVDDISAAISKMNI